MKDLVEDAFLSMQGDLRKSIRKMKYKDAIKEIKELCKAICIEPTEEKCSKCALSVAIDCIDKQIPKKSEDSYIQTNIATRIRSSVCPVCKAHLIITVREQQKYCDNCGQAIKWSEDETIQE